MSGKYILLYDIEGAALVIDHPSGVHYRNQVGGNLCIKADQEGVLAPIDWPSDTVDALEEHDFYQGRQRITEADADFIDRLLASSPVTGMVTVDRGRLGESWEAWVYVAIMDTPSSSDLLALRVDSSMLYGFSGARGVLTWQNSD